MNEFLRVVLWDMEVGRLVWDGRKKMSYFTYNPDFLKNGFDVAPLTAPIGDRRSLLPVYGDSGKIYQKLPPFIADSLPDTWGNQLFERWRIQNHLSQAAVTPLEKLAFIGKRGMGALEFLPEIERGRTQSIDIAALYSLARRIMEERENAVIAPEEEVTMHSLILVGTSAGGRQPKAVVAINPDTGEIRSGQIAGLSGFEYYILKFGDQERNSAQIEMTYYDMAIRSKIEMMCSRMLPVEGISHFLTLRFDRLGGGEKLHTQTLAAMCPEADSYEKLIMVCRRLRLSEKDCEEVFRRMVFNVLAGNTDDHNKNFSFIMDREGKWRLAPAYDMTFIFDMGGFNPNREHCLMIRGKVSGITKDDILDFARDNGIRRPGIIIEEVAESLLQFRALAEKNGVAHIWISIIENSINANLSEFGFNVEKLAPLEFDVDGHHIENACLEMTYKGNIHLTASIDSKPKKYVITPKNDNYDMIMDIGLANINKDIICKLIQKCLFV